MSSRQRIAAVELSVDQYDVTVLSRKFSLAARQSLKFQLGDRADPPGVHSTAAVKSVHSAPTISTVFHAASLLPIGQGNDRLSAQQQQQVGGGRPCRDSKTEASCI